ncbi:hypothetical protein OG497_37545 [Streptomyces sp. NBC_01242]|uniref:hypothetical protein n=1 Tax=Streptomyces sp. NBC_01242 TaxID=2903795 RepID=UPI002254A47C|nr:hypothetical protein [Streptomyces sp. NBC_01242]MCX4799562.1 hypothetical protein [Streptomyces sp. NBC_01242]
MQIALPNGGVYKGGDEVTLSDKQFAVIPAQNLVAFFSSVTPVGGGGVESVNDQTGVVVLTPASIGAAAASHTHTAAQVTGTFTAAQVPTLDAAKVGTGVFASARLPKGVAVANLAADADTASVVTAVNALLASLRVNHIAP